MVKEYVDEERRHRGEKPCAPQALYRSNPAPDWWPAGCAVSPRPLAQPALGMHPPAPRGPEPRKAAAQLIARAAASNFSLCPPANANNPPTLHP